MRALRVCLIAAAATACVATLQVASAQMMKAPAAPAAKGTASSETRYFTSIDGLMDGNADVVLRETRQGKNVTAATLDVCYPAEKGSERRDRFVADLTVNGNALTGATQSQIDKLPVTVKLTRRPTGDSFEFKGQITVGQTTTSVTSTDNSDQSEKEFRDNQTADDNIMAAPKDFTEVSPEAVAVKIKIEAALDFVRTLRGQQVELSLASLNVSCDALRAGEQVINLNIDPERAAAFIARAKAYPGVVNAGWTSGSVDMERTVRFNAAEWRDGDKIARDKVAATLSGVLAKSLSAKPAGVKWDDETGRVKLSFKRPSQVVPALELTETVEVGAIVSPDKPGTSDKLILWISAPSVATTDEASGAKLNLADTANTDEESDPRDDNGAVAALAAEFKAQRWDSDKSVWK
ncbi:hypothetical protein FNL55_21790 [Tardiphaga sp. vice352]|uniref:hypothetical protein n=1 Tax=unclassified Tardiphaga TaxID=2631404 RepID=UPI001162A2B8|nr:hypothetical protein FNL53_22305 [Tardiphaga sp. vice278]QDM23363.1 hypothetical protein FIU28_21105 [Tardiphaga sp. vice154]QDM28583.1 hypothetical protein FNL56_22540 [Tardiphaga sp. vice304]QDM33683.1 hypothetical protein FNL55_21790 [Tardiphaga sp. vice352]